MQEFRCDGHNALKASLCQACPCGCIGALCQCGLQSIRSGACPQPRSIFSGITYGCELLERSEEGHGILHWVRVELRAPGIELYVTPLDPSALARRLSISTALDRRRRCEMNALRSPSMGPVHLKAQLATGIARGSRKGGGDRCFGPCDEPFLGTHLSPVVRRCAKRASAAVQAAKAGRSPKGEMGDRRAGRWLREGKIWSGSDRKPDKRTAIGIDAERKLLFLTVAEWASPRLLLEQLSKLGARDAMLLDGGGSSAMAIGEGGRDLARGALLGGWRPVATFFGVKARRLDEP